MSSKRSVQKNLSSCTKRDKNGKLLHEKLSPSALLAKLTVPAMDMEEILREDELENLWEPRPEGNASTCMLCIICVRINSPPQKSFSTIFRTYKQLHFLF